MFAQAGTSGDEVEYFDDLGAEAAGEASVAADGVLACDATLFVSCGPKGEPSDAEKAVMGVHAVSGGEDIGQVGAHRFIDDDGAFDAELGPGSCSKFGVWPYSDNDQS